ncbi:MAG TPA: prohibitin family protein [Rhodanobacteraceae bacterium]|nr:prohibitin family protein [Rhodanobacteraceae bacterium]
MKAVVPMLPSIRKPRLVEIAVAVLVLLLLWSSFVTIGPGERGVLMTFGAVQHGVLAPGLHMKIPLVQTVKRMNVQIQKSQTQETAASRDLQDVTSEVAVNWSINPLDAEWVYERLGDESQLADKVIAPIVSNAVKAVAAHYDAEQLVEKRDQVRDEIQQQIVVALTQYKVQVQGVNITNFQFSQDYSHAIEQKQVAQQRAQQAEYDLARVKVQAQQEVAQAEGQAQAQKLLQSTLTPQIIQLKAVEKWNGVLPQVTGNGAVPFIGNMDTMAKPVPPAAPRG